MKGIAIRFLPSLTLVALVACGGGANAPAVASPSAAAAHETAPAEEATASPSNEVPKPLQKPASVWKAGPASVSSATDEQIAAAVKSAGWTVEGPPTPSTACLWEGRYVKAKKGKLKAEIAIKRPWSAPDEACDAKAAHSPANDLRDPAKYVSENWSQIYDAAGDILITVDIEGGGTKADAKKLLDAAFKK